jgi:hypothetical protein
MRKFPRKKPLPGKRGNAVARGDRERRLSPTRAVIPPVEDRQPSVQPKIMPQNRGQYICCVFSDTFLARKRTESKKLVV